MAEEVTDWLFLEEKERLELGNAIEKDIVKTPSGLCLKQRIPSRRR